MRYLSPVPWRDVRPGTVVLDRVGVVRTVVMNLPNAITRTVALEGDPTVYTVSADQPITPVELDAADAIGNLHAAGLNPTPIGDQPS